MRFDIQGEVPSDAPGIWSPWPRGNMLLSSKVLVPGREGRSDSTGIVSAAMRRPQRAKLPHVAYDTHGFVQSYQCLWPTLYRFPSCRRMRDLDHSRGPKACTSQIGQRQKVPPIHVSLPGPKTRCEWVISAVL